MFSVIGRIEYDITSDRSEPQLNVRVKDHQNGITWKQLLHPRNVVTQIDSSGYQIVSAPR